MKKNFLLFFLLVMALGWLALILILSPLPLKAANPQDVVINEVAWMGTSSSTADEWIELRNLTGANIDLSGWTLTADDGTPNIALAGLIPAQGYYLLERTDDTSAPGVAADLIYTGALGDGGENLTLSDQSANLIDNLDASAGWPAGDSGANLTMERTDQGSWQNSFIIDGTPKAANSQAGGDNPLCGNGQLEADEQCDEGENNGASCLPDYGASCDYCSDSCQLETVNGPFCGDNLINGDEQCDDGNTLAGDGCDEQCIIEAEDNSGARGYKLAAFELINSLKSDQSGLNRLIEEAAKLIEQSLADNYWLEQNQLDPSQGHRVFTYETRAISKLNLVLRLAGILRLTGFSQAGADDLSQAVDDLAQADKMVAETAFNQAQAAWADNDDRRNSGQRLINRAENIMELAVKNIPTNPRLAVLYFSQVWWLSQRAME